MNRLPHSALRSTLQTLAIGALIALATAIVSLPLTPPQAAEAAAAPHISGFDVRAVERIEPGAKLGFTVWGTPGARAHLRIAGVRRALPLVEAAPGRYQASYTVSRGDRIAPDARVNADLNIGGRVYTAALDEPLERRWSAPPLAGVMPHIQRLDVRIDSDRRVGTPVTVALRGTAGGRASVHLPGLEQQRLVLDEVSPGRYEATYFIQPGDRIDAGEAASARLRIGHQVATASAAFDAGNTALLSWLQQTLRVGQTVRVGNGTPSPLAEKS